MGGQFWVGWYWYGPSSASFIIDVLGLQLAPEMELRARAYAATAQSACWWWPHSDFVMVSERPLNINRDANGRLHSATGPAISWPDGWGLYMWHGLRVPAEWILHPDKLDPQTALNWKNVEQRRAAAEIIGWARVLDALKARSVDKDEDPQIGELLEVDLPDSPKQKFLRVRCGTQRTFCLPVPPEMKTALQANAWTFRIEDPAGLKSFRNYTVRT